jgi:hypothetical protein
VLPVSLNDEIGVDTVKIYCPKCSQVYHPPPARGRTGIASGVDGAAFGTTFPHLFLMTFSNLVPDPLPTDSQYVPRVFGFRVHKAARQRFNAPPPPRELTLPAAAEAPAEQAASEKKPAEQGEKSPPPLENNHDVAGTAAGATSTGAAVASQHSQTSQQEDDMKSRSQGVKRKTSSLQAAVDAAADAKKEGNGSVGTVPTFLVDNNLKRRRKNSNSGSK